jgi:crotonobetainyl-CoA:carnitine CoA-transferase CaiB-like acyl-CoA transferase
MTETASTLGSVRVLELASVLAGPLAGAALAERGAQVTKVERPPHGDVTRSWKTDGESKDTNSSAYYASANGNKEVVWKDLKSKEGRQWLEEALASHDVVIENFKTADLPSFGLQPEALAQRHPHLVHVRLIGFEGQPHRLAYDVVVQAETGFMHMNGNAGAPPMRMPVALMDVLASHQIRMAAMEGLLARSGGDTGFFAEVSLEASGLSALVNQATNHLNAGASPTRNGGLHPNIAPYGDVLQCMNGFVVLAVGNDRQFEALCNVLGNAKWAEDDRFATNQLRVLNRNVLMPLLQLAAGEFEKTDLMTQLTNNSVPAGLVKSMEEVFQPGTNGFNALTTNDDGQIRPKSIAYRSKCYGFRADEPETTG